MTYDLTVPEPGSDILSKIVEIKSLTAALQEGFGSPDSTLPWARFDLTPYQVTRGSYLGLAAQYGVTVEPPPAEQLVITRTFTRNWQSKDSASDDDYTTFDIDVPEGYEITAWAHQFERWSWVNEPWHFAIRPDLNTWLGIGGHVTMSVGTRFVSAFDIQLKLWFGLQPAAYDAWRQRAWGTLREAAQSRYELNRTMLRARLRARFRLLRRDGRLRRPRPEPPLHDDRRRDRGVRAHELSRDGRRKCGGGRTAAPLTGAGEGMA